MLKVDARHGVKGLFPASESYFLDRTGNEPLQATCWALVHLFQLRLHSYPLTLYHLDDAALARCTALIANPCAATTAIERMAARLLASVCQPSAAECTKGRFFDRASEKLRRAEGRAARHSAGDRRASPNRPMGSAALPGRANRARGHGVDVGSVGADRVARVLVAIGRALARPRHGVPKDYAGARDLAERDKHEFQKWITATIGAQPYKGGKKGMDRGIDGYLHFRDADKKPQFAIVSVKGGENINSGMERDLKGTMDREKAALGLFLTLNPPSREMTKEAVAAGFYETGGMKVPRLQILTAENILEGKRAQVPFGFSEGFKQAVRESTEKQGKLL
jgi:hypothetical protein